ncbi:hypothetical protein ABW19_dt0206992 [Dactylella cylindrospora]|nr:hypothetical protein ABW19_dt0206992 [Dactylella cylindrospora]
MGYKPSADTNSLEFAVRLLGVSSLILGCFAFPQLTPRDMYTGAGTNTTARHGRTFAQKYENTWNWKPIQNYVGIPVTWGRSGWYTFFTIGTYNQTNQDAMEKFKLAISTRDANIISLIWYNITLGLRSWITSIYQNQSENYDPNTGLRHPLYDPTLSSTARDFPDIRPVPCFSWRGVIDRFHESQKAVQTGNITDIPSYQTCHEGRDDLIVDGVPIATYANIFPLGHQTGFDDIDGRLGLGDLLTGPGRGGFWNNTGVFATYFSQDPMKHSLLEFNPSEANIEKYPRSGAITWIPSHNQLGSQQWTLYCDNVKVAGRELPRYTAYGEPNQVTGLFSGYTKGVNIVYDSPIESVAAKNITYQDFGYLDSVSRWTRLHPVWVNSIYDKIPGAIYYQKTYFVPCNTTNIPEIEIGVSDFFGDKGFRTWLKMDNEYFLIHDYKHPEDKSYCAGNVQDMVNRPPWPVAVFGQWFFENLYILFKSNDGAPSPNTKMIGLAHKV